MSQPYPIVGSIVHYGYVKRHTAHTGPAVTVVGPLTPMAALVTKVSELGETHLHVFLPEGSLVVPNLGESNPGVRHSDTLKEGHWTWPPKHDVRWLPSDPA